jgi:acetyl esterase
MTPDLPALMGTLAESLVQPVGWPTAAPAEGRSRADWLAEVQRLRDQHDAMTLQLDDALGGQGWPDGPVARVEYRQVPVDGGAITARVYTPEGEGPFPAVLVLHGGGWWMGGGAVGFQLNDPMCRAITGSLGAVTVNVDYRLAPEHPYPVQLEDAYSALSFVRVDPDRVAVLGVSSGGNLAAALTLLDRDRHGVPLVAQLLQVPALDLTLEAERFEHDEATREAGRRVRDYYTQGGDHVRSSYLSPALAEDLTGLPPAVVVTGEFDPLSDDGRTYVQRLTEAGVPARLLSYPMAHGVATPDVAAAWTRDFLAAAAGLLAPGGAARDAPSGSGNGGSAGPVGGH